MSRKTDRPTTPRHILIYNDNWDFLQRYFGEGAPPNRRYGAGFMCRKLIDKAIRDMQVRMQAAQEEETVDA